MTGKKTYQRRLTEKQASRCENALTPRCRCRCGGSLHGAKRGGEDVPSRAFFEELADDDPHRVRTWEELEARKDTARHIRYARFVKKKLEHDCARLLELGSTANAAVLEKQIKEMELRIEWLRTRAHVTTP